MHVDVGAREADLNAGIRGNGVRLHVHIERMVIPQIPRDSYNVTVFLKSLANEINDDDHADHAKNTDNQENFAGCNSPACTAFSRGNCALVELHQSPDNEDEREPVKQDMPEADVAVSPEEKHYADTNEQQSAKEPAGAWTI
jgi:hypothetical protein